VSIYPEFIALADEMLAEFGQTCFWKKPAAIVDAEPGYPTAGAVPDPVQCEMVFFSARDLNRGVAEFLMLMPGSEVSLNDQIGLLSGSVAFAPHIDDFISRGDVDAEPITVSKIDLIAPDGTPVLYLVTVI
jgi:hypothetical protein